MKLIENHSFQSAREPYTKFHRVFKRGIFGMKLIDNPRFQSAREPYTKFHRVFKWGLF